MSVGSTRGSNEPDAKKRNETIKRVIGLVGGVASLVIACAMPGGEVLSAEGIRAIGVLVFCVFFWVCNTLPVGITSVLGPILLLILSVRPTFGESFDGFIDQTTWFVFGVYCFTGLVKKTTLGQRLTSVFVKLAKKNSRGIVLAFMVATAMLSMFITDGGAVATGMAIAAPFLDTIDGMNTKRNFGRALAIGIAVGAIVGGFVTPFGHALNILCLGLMQSAYGITVGFVQWFIPGLLCAIILIPTCWFILCKVYPPEELSENESTIAITGGENGFGPMQAIDKKVLVFILCVLALFVASNWVPFLSSAKIILVALAVTFLPGVNMYTWEEFVESEGWGTWLMVGGAMCVGNAITATGAGSFIADLFLSSGLFDLNIVLALLLFTLIIYLAHTFIPVAPAWCTLFVPPLMALCVAQGVSPAIFVMLMASVTAGSFLMPFNPPMLISYTPGYYSIGELVKAGWVMVIAYVVVEVLVLYFVGGLLLPMV